MARYTGPSVGSVDGTGSSCFSRASAASGRSAPSSGATIRRRSRPASAASCPSMRTSSRRSRRRATSTACSSAVPQALRDGRAGPGRDRRQPAAGAGEPAGQRGVPPRVRGLSQAGPPAGPARPLLAERPADGHPLGAGQGRRHRLGDAEGPTAGVLQDRSGGPGPQGGADLAQAGRLEHERARSLRCPGRDEIEVAINEQLVVEYYSR